MADNLDEVFAEPMEAAESSPSQETEAAVEPTPETVEEPAPEPTPEVVEPQQDRSGYVPIDAMLTEREKRQELQRQIDAIRAQQSQAQPQAVPDPFDDPAGYQGYVDQQVEARFQKQRADMSYTLAVRDHGKDIVEAARSWALEKAQRDPVFGQQVEAAFQNEMLPVDWVVQQHKRDVMLSEIGDRSMDDFVRDYLSKNPGLMQNASVAAAQPAVIPTQATTPVKVPRSLATQGSGPSDVRQTATGALAGVDSLFS